ncbi:hypothetical protein AMTR_s05144p00006120, partial [Amborella trichopoda]
RPTARGACSSKNREPSSPSLAGRRELAYREDGPALVRSGLLRNRRHQEQERGSQLL